MINNFKSDELIKVQGKIYPLVGARLRLAHEDNKEICIQTNLLHYNPDYVVVRASIKTNKGIFTGMGNSSTKRDKNLSNAILELAETRAIARALRFAGYGVEYTGYEEVTDSNIVDNSNEPSSKAQLNIIFSIAKSLDISTQELRDLIIKATGKVHTKDLTKYEADKVIKILKSDPKEKSNLMD